MAVRVSAGQAYQVARQVEDPERLAHVQYEQVRASTEGRSVKDQPRGLGNGHEEPGHVGVGDREWLPVLELFAQDRHHASIGTEHVAEANRDIRAAVPHGGLGDEQFRDPLGGAHHARRSDGLVGRDEDEVSDVGFHRGIEHDHRPPMFTCTASDRVILHQRYMLVGGCMDDDVGPLARDEPTHLRATGDVRQVDRTSPLPCFRRRRDLSSRSTRYRGLRPVDEEKALGPDGKDLPGQFRPDEPPPPVITTVRSRISSSTPAACSVTIGRRSRSSTRTLRTRWASMLPSRRSAEGRDRSDLEELGRARPRRYRARHCPLPLAW